MNVRLNLIYNNQINNYLTIYYIGDIKSLLWLLGHYRLHQLFDGSYLYRMLILYMIVCNDDWYYVWPTHPRGVDALKAIEARNAPSHNIKFSWY